ncbi:TauD/TfdA family dioxygenase [Marinobacter litoralis]|uniref:TauD/TfdA family dioxygenase n=1 Tax=Marinobacter litoralis TaxID=187981 RepID=UPI0018EB82CE|nr:TauD/TfdA family dioxygenase [Marinobacter litoralis]MBJ6136078.1 TauD/TfdA family dioxygenase [Marinobacter litoralis]
MPRKKAPRYCLSSQPESLQAFLVWASSHRNVLDKLIVTHGGVVLRGFPVRETDDFGALVELFPSFAGDYVGGLAPRTQIAGKVMEATRLDKNAKIRLHSEMAYMQNYPPRIAFFSKSTAHTGGETIIADTRELIGSLSPELREKLETLGVMTVRNFAAPSGRLDESVPHVDLRGWDLAFQTDERDEVTARCKERGLEPIWNKDGSLTVVNRTAAVVVHPQTEQKLYRSNLHIYRVDSNMQGLDPEIIRHLRENQERPSGTFLGDGQPLAEEEALQFTAHLDQKERAWSWKDGDVMILDNLQVWHGRNPFEGSRDVQVAMLG